MSNVDTALLHKVLLYAIVYVICNKRLNRIHFNVGYTVLLLEFSVSHLDNMNC